MRWKGPSLRVEKMGKWFKKFAWSATRMGRGYVQYHDGDYVWLEYYYELRFYDEDSMRWSYVGGPTWTQDPFKWNYDDPNSEIDYSDPIGDLKDESFLAMLATSPNDHVRELAQDRLKEIRSSRSKRYLTRFIKNRPN